MSRPVVITSLAEDDAHHPFIRSPYWREPAKDDYYLGPRGGHHKVKITPEVIKQQTLCWQPVVRGSQLWVCNRTQKEHTS